MKNKIIKREYEFNKWFVKNYKKLGYSDIIRKDIGKFPDFIMLKDGKEVLVELETVASNFIAHKHPLDKVDEIVCIVNDIGLEKPVIVAKGLDFKGSSKIKVTVNIDNKIYTDFQKFCEENAFVVSKKIELFIQKFLKNNKNFVLLFGLVFLNLFLIGSVSAVDIAWDDFECNGFNCGTGWLDAWSYSGDCVITGLGPSPIGSYHMRGQESAEGNCIADRNFSNFIYGSANISFWAVTDVLEDGDYCRYYYFDGSSYTLLLELTNADETYTQYTYDVSQYGLSSNAKIRMRQFGVGADNCFIDDINITGYGTSDSTPPNITSLTETPSDPQTYSAGVTYEFNATVNDSSTIDKVILEFNGTNYTASNLSNVYNITLTDLPAGTFNYRWFANDSAGNANNTETGTYTINKASSTTTLTVTPASPIGYGNETNFSCKNNQGLTVTLYLNEIDITSQNHLNITRAANTTGHNVTCIAIENQNYSSSSDETSYIINKANGQTTLKLNNLEDNLTIQYPQQLNASASTLYGSLTLYRESIDITSENNQNISLAAGYYNYTATSSGDQNYSSSTITYFTNITKATPTASLTSTNDWTINYGQGTTIGIVETNTGDLDLTYNVYRDNINVGTGFINLSSGSYTYILNTTGGANYTENSSMNTQTLTINQISSSINLTLNKTQENSTIDEGTTIDLNCSIISGDPEATLELYKDTTKINSGNSPIGNATNFLTIGEYNITCIYLNTQNYSTTSQSWWVIVRDIQPPIINIVHPQSTTYGNNNSLPLNFTVSDNNLDSCWYNINNQANITLTNCQNTTFNVSGTGAYTLYLFANDTSGNKNSTNISFSVQLGAPNITINSPENNSYLNYFNIQFNYTPTDADLEVCELWGDFNGTFQLNQTDNSPTSSQINDFQLNLTDGTYLWAIKCNDSLGYSTISNNNTLTIDTITPALTLTQPTGEKTSMTSVPLTLTANDTNLNSCWYNVYQGASIHKSNTTITNCTSTTFDVSATGTFILNLYTNDSAGNTNSTNSSFSVSTTTPPTPPPGGGGGGGGGSILPKNQTGKLEASIIREIIAQQGDKKTLLINVKNIGRTFLNNCKLSAKGEIISWIYSTQIQGIAPGENIDFIFDLNIPEGINPKDYTGELEVKCEEGINKQELTIKIPAGLQSIEIKEIQHTKEGLDINYNFKNTELPEENINIEIWIINSDKIEIKRITDSFQPTNEITQRKITMELPKDTIGIHDVYFALSSNKENYVKQSIVLGESRTTGQAILGETGSKIAGYIVFFLILGTLIFFGLRGHFKNKKKTKTSLLKKDKKTKSKKPITKNAKK